MKIADGRIAEIRFRAKGCVAAMACGSAVTELVRGKTVAEARKLSREELLRAVGGLPAGVVARQPPGDGCAGGGAEKLSTRN